MDAAHCDTLIRLIETGTLNTRPLLTHRMLLEQIKDAYELFAHRPDSCIKVCITP